MGRKKITNYERIILPNWEKIRQMVAHSGCTENAIAAKIGISYASWNNYKRDHEDFAQMVACANIDLITEVWDEVYQAAKKHEVETISTHIREMVIPDGTIRKTKDVDSEKKIVEPSMDAAKMILRNRDEEYIDKSRTETRLRQQLQELQAMKIEAKDENPAAEMEDMLAAVRKMQE